MKQIYIKVCGMKDSQNIEDLQELHVDLFGMIFYPKSPRYIENLDPSILPDRKYGTERVGVFVNESIEVVKEKILKYSLDLIQLHGNETYEDCLKLNEIVPVIKAFSIKDEADILKVNEYGKIWGYYLFDTKTVNHGGSGEKFDWSILDHYTADIPFYLSGGISSKDIEPIKAIKHPQFVGIDLNSRFEIEPGLKNINLLKEFIKEIRS